jgi:hypothetical protein
MNLSVERSDAAQLGIVIGLHELLTDLEQTPEPETQAKPDP